MKRAYLVSLVLQACLLAMPAVGSAQAIGKAMGNLRWGMSDTEVVRVVKTRLADQYGEKIKKAKGSQKAQLERELATKQKEVGGVFEFSGKSSRWDRTPIAGEYGYGTEESMLNVNDGESDNYYFFLEGRLWKWVKLYPSSNFGGKGFSKFSDAISKKFGKGYKKESELNGSSKKFTFLEYLDRNNRLRAVDRSDANSYSLVFEEMATVRQIASIRPQTKKAPSRLATADDEEEEVAKKPEKAEKKERRSVFGEDENEESEQGYEARKNDMVAKKREQQRKAYEREQELKKGKALDSLQEVNDDDPLAGVN
jgi:hypothetical protein